MIEKIGRFLLWTAIIVGAIVGIARATALRWWRVPEGDPYLEASIAPTLRGGDLVILWRLGKPKFGDLVVCPEPKAPDRVVIGRIVGESGDQVSIERDTLKVNGRSAETETACDPFETIHPATKKAIKQNCSVEAVAGVSHLRGGSAGQNMPTRPAQQRVAEGMVFLASDNRALPYDSRDYGLVERDTCTETVVFRLVSAAGYLDSKSRFTFIQ